MSQLLWTDYVLILIVLISTLMSIRRGLLKELFSLINLGLAIFIAFRFSGAIANFVNSMFGLKISEAFAMTASFLIFYLTATKLTNKIIRRANETKFKGFNRILGIVFGFIRGVFVVVAIVALGLLSMFYNGDAWLKTPITLAAKPASDMFLSFIPDKVEQAVQAQIKEADQSPIVQQTKKLMNAVFGMDLEIKKTTDTKSTSSAQKPAESKPVAPGAVQPEALKSAPSNARPDISNTPLINQRSYAPRMSDREILLEKKRQLEEQRSQQGSN